MMPVRHLPRLLGLATMCVGTAAHAERKAQIAPYLGLDQTVITDLHGGNGDTLTYTSVVVGVDAHIQGQNAEIQASLAYEHQFSWTKDTPDQDVISGLVNARVDLVRDALSLEGGALATRVRTDGFTGANGSLAGAGSRAQVYSAYVGPTFRSEIGDLDVSAVYRLGYNKLENGFDAALSNAPSLDSFGESWTHYGNVTIGMRPDAILPFGWQGRLGYAREDASQLDQRFEDKWARLDLTLPVSLDLALVGGVGYEMIEISNRDALRNTNGDPIRDAGGRFITDSASPRLLAYDSDEIIWDAGISWRPSSRTSAELMVGHRYGSMSYTGSFNWRPDPRSSLNISLYDSVDSFGRALNGDLANLPSGFSISRNPFSGDLAGCALGGAQGGGVCFSDSLAGIRTANFRHRGITASYAHGSGPWEYGIAAGFSRRKFIANDTLFAGVNGVTDENFFGAIAVGYAFDGRSGIDANVYANQFSSGFAGVADVFNAGAYVSYHRRFLRHLQATASVGIDHARQSGVDSVLTGLAQIGVRYQF